MAPRENNITKPVDKINSTVEAKPTAPSIDLEAAVTASIAHLKKIRKENEKHVDDITKAKTTIEADKDQTDESKQITGPDLARLAAAVRASETAILPQISDTFPPLVKALELVDRQESSVKAEQDGKAKSEQDRIRRDHQMRLRRMAYDVWDKSMSEHVSAGLRKDKVKVRVYTLAEAYTAFTILSDAKSIEKIPEDLKKICVKVIAEEVERTGIPITYTTQKEAKQDGNQEKNNQEQGVSVVSGETQQTSQAQANLRPESASVDSALNTLAGEENKTTDENSLANLIKSATPDANSPPETSTPLPPADKKALEDELTQMVGPAGEARTKKLQALGKLRDELKEIKQTLDTLATKAKSSRIEIAKVGVEICTTRISTLQTEIARLEHQLAGEGDESNMRAEILKLTETYHTQKAKVEGLQESVKAISERDVVEITDRYGAAYAKWIELAEQASPGTDHLQTALLLSKMSEFPAANLSSEAGYANAMLVKQKTEYQTVFTPIDTAIHAVRSAKLALETTCSRHGYNPTPLSDAELYKPNGIVIYKKTVESTMSSLLKETQTALDGISNNTKDAHKDIAELQAKLTELPINTAALTLAQQQKSEYERVQKVFELLAQDEPITASEAQQVLATKLRNNSLDADLTLDPSARLRMPISGSDLSEKVIIRGDAIIKPGSAVIDAQSEALVESGARVIVRDGKRFLHIDGKYVGEFDKTNGKFKAGADSVEQLAGTNMYQVKDESKIYLLNDKAKLSGGFQNQFKDGVDRIDTFDTGKFMVLKGEKKWLMDDEGKLLGQFRDREQFGDGVAEISKSSVEGIYTVKKESGGKVMTYVTDASGEPLGEFGPKGAFSAGATACEVCMHSDAAYVIVTMSGDKSFVTDTKGTLLSEFRKGKLFGNGVSKESINFREYNAKDRNVIPALEVTAADGKVYLLELNRGVVLEYPAGMEPPNLQKKLQGVFEMKIKSRLDALMAKIPKVPQLRVPDVFKRNEKKKLKTIPINITKQTDSSWKYSISGFEASFPDSVFTDDKYQQVTLGENHVVFLKKVGDTITPAALHTTSVRLAKGFASVNSLEDTLMGTADAKEYLLTQTDHDEPKLAPDFETNGIFSDGLSGCTKLLNRVLVGTTTEFASLDLSQQTPSPNIYLFDSVGKRLGEFAEGGHFANGTNWSKGSDMYSEHKGGMIITVGEPNAWYAIDSTGNRIGLFANGKKFANGVKTLTHSDVDGERRIKVSYIEDTVEKSMILDLDGNEVTNMEDEVKNLTAKLGLVLDLSKLVANEENEQKKLLNVLRECRVEADTADKMKDNFERLNNLISLLSQLKSYLENHNGNTQVIEGYLDCAQRWAIVFQARLQDVENVPEEINDLGTSVRVQLRSHTVTVTPNHGKQREFDQKIDALDTAYPLAKGIQGVTVPPTIKISNISNNIKVIEKYYSLRAQGCPLFLDKENKNDKFFQIPTKIKAQALCSYLDFLAKCNDQNRALIDHKGDSVFLQAEGHITIVDAGMLYEAVLPDVDIWQKEFGKNKPVDMRLGTFLSRFFTCQSTGDMENDGGLVPASIKSVLQEVNEGKYPSAKEVADAIRKIINDTDKTTEFEVCDTVMSQHVKVVGELQSTNSIPDAHDEQPTPSRRIGDGSRLGRLREGQALIDTRSILEMELNGKTFTPEILNYLTAQKFDELSNDNKQPLKEKLTRALSWSVWSNAHSQNIYQLYQSALSTFDALAKQGYFDHATRPEVILLTDQDVNDLAWRIKNEADMITFLQSREVERALPEDESRRKMMILRNLGVFTGSLEDANQAIEANNKFIAAGLVSATSLNEQLSVRLQNEQNELDKYDVKRGFDTIISDDIRSQLEVKIAPPYVNKEIFTVFFQKEFATGKSLTLDDRLQRYVLRQVLVNAGFDKSGIDPNNCTIDFDQKKNKITLSNSKAAKLFTNKIELTFTDKGIIQVARSEILNVDEKVISLKIFAPESDTSLENMNMSMRISEDREKKKSMVFTVAHTDSYISSVRERHEKMIANIETQIRSLSNLDTAVNMAQNQVHLDVEEKKVDVRAETSSAPQVPESHAGLAAKSETTTKDIVDAVLDIQNLNSTTLTDEMLKYLTTLNLTTLEVDLLDRLKVKLSADLQWGRWSKESVANEYVEYQKLVSIRDALTANALITSNEHFALIASQVSSIACDIKESDQLIAFLTSKEAQDAFLKSNQGANNQTMYDIYANHVHSLDAKKREEVLKRFVNSKLLTPLWIHSKTGGLLQNERIYKENLHKKDNSDAQGIREEVIEDRKANIQTFTEMNIDPADINARILARIFGITEYKNVRIEFDAELQTYIFKKIMDLSLFDGEAIDITNHSVYFDKKHNKITLARGLLGPRSVNRIELEFTGDAVTVDQFTLGGKKKSHTSLWKALHSTDLPAEDLATSMSIEGEKGSEHIVFSTNFTKNYITKKTAEHDEKIALYTNQIQYLDSEIKKEEDEKKKVDTKNANDVSLQSANEAKVVSRVKEAKEYLTELFGGAQDTAVKVNDAFIQKTEELANALATANIPVLPDALRAYSSFQKGYAEISKLLKTEDAKKVLAEAGSHFVAGLQQELSAFMDLDLSVSTTATTKAINEVLDNLKSSINTKLEDLKLAANRQAYDEFTTELNMTILKGKKDLIDKDMTVMKSSELTTFENDAKDLEKNIYLYCRSLEAIFKTLFNRTAQLEDLQIPAAANGLRVVTQLIKSIKDRREALEKATRDFETIEHQARQSIATAARLANETRERQQAQSAPATPATSAAASEIDTPQNTPEAPSPSPNVVKVINGSFFLTKDRREALEKATKDFETIEDQARQSIATAARLANETR
ncbi:MAG: hypothetical protein WCJ70_04105, partial [bacterium]